MSLNHLKSVSKRNKSVLTQTTGISLVTVYKYNFLKNILSPFFTSCIHELERVVTVWKQTQ